jgi:hypothetical protein
MLKKKTIESTIERPNLLGTNLLKEKPFNSSNNHSISASSDTKGPDSFFNKYNNLMRNVFPNLETNNKNTFNSINFDKNATSNLGLLTSFMKKEKSRDLSISQKLSDLKLTILVKQSNNDQKQKEKNDDIKLFKSNSQKNKSKFLIILKKIKRIHIKISKFHKFL